MEAFNKMDQKKKVQIAILAIVLVALFAWFFLRGGGEEMAPIGDPLLMMDPSGGGATQSDVLIGQELLSALQSMKSLKLDTTFIKDPLFTNLEDLTIIIPQQPIGRTNPFAELK